MQFKRVIASSAAGAALAFVPGVECRPLQTRRPSFEGRVTTPRRPLRTRAIAAFLAMVMVWTFEGSPLYSAWWEPAAPKRDAARTPAAGQADAIRFDDLVTEARDLLRSVRTSRSSLGHRQRLTALCDAFKAENLKVERQFAEVDGLVASRDLPSDVRARHESLARGYRAKIAATVSTRRPC